MPRADVPQITLRAAALAVAALLAGPLPGAPPPPPVFASLNFGGDLPAHPERLEGLLAESVRRGARYVVLPELALAAPEPVPGPLTRALGEAASRHGIWLAFALPEKGEKEGKAFLTTVLLDDRGRIAERYRKVMVRPGAGGPPVARGSFHQIVDAVDHHGLRLGIMAGDDLQVGVPRLANRGADTILITAAWGPQDPVNWDEQCRKLSRQLAVNLVVASRGGVFGGVYTREGELLPPAAGGVVTTPLPRRQLPWRIEPALGLPAAVPVPSHQPATAEIAELGRKLFFDTNLSSTGQVSCASCHQPDKAFTNGEARGRGVHGRTTMRNVPSLLNVAYRPLLRWDGYASMIENFVKYPISDRNEMDFHFLDKVVAYLRSRPEYVAEFRSALGTETIEFEHVERALATYQRTLISGGSPFDRYQYGGDPDALGESARRGLALFTGKAACAGCHQIGERYALFMDSKYHFLGVGYDAAPGESPDIGLGNVSTNLQAGLFQTPSLRNVAETAPYMHDGSFRTLEQVIDFYDRGGAASGTQAPEIRPLGLSEQEKRDLLAFLRSLTGGHRYDSQGRRLDG